MSLIQLYNVTFGYAGQTVLADLSASITPGKRIGLVGPNGAGKSTLLALLAGEFQPEAGQRSVAQGATIAWVRQSIDSSAEGTLWDHLAAPFASALDLQRKLSALEKQMESQSTQDLLDKYASLQQAYSISDGYQIESQIRRLTQELGFSEDDHSRSISTLSGGERMRVELAKQLLSPPNVLLLDEPTNHLDIAGIESLESRLQRWATDKTFVVISHDRRFVEAVCNEIWEIEKKKLVVFPFGYQKYCLEREKRHQQQMDAYILQQKHIAQTEEFIRRNLAGQNTKQAQSRRTMLAKEERLEKPTDAFSQATQWKFSLGAGAPPSGKEVFSLHHVSIGHDATSPLCSLPDTTVYRGDRIGIVGNNGSGKSSLIKTILGQLEPLSGNITTGSNVKIAYFDQRLDRLRPQQTALDHIVEMRPDWNDHHARTHLGAFLFSGDEVEKKASVLSGGERNRLLLAMQALIPCNVLILDEPTNHLDWPACSILERALLSFSGTLLVVSHDRLFLDQVVTKIWSLDHKRKVMTEHLGNYTAFRERIAVNSPARSDILPESNAKKPGATLREEQKDRERKRKRKQQLENQIALLEKSLAAIVEKMAATADDWKKLEGLQQDKDKTAQQIDELMAEWASFEAENN